MIAQDKFVVGTSGYSFPDWVGTYYPEGTTPRAMFGLYVRRFAAVELNFTFYAMPAARTLAKLAQRSPAGFEFWVKANQEITHAQDRALARPFVEALAPLRAAGKLAGVVLQFPQSFHRTPASRKFLEGVLEDMAAAAREPLPVPRNLEPGAQGILPFPVPGSAVAVPGSAVGVPLAVEFRHSSWSDAAVFEGLRERRVTLVVPDAPALPGLFHCAATLTSRLGYLRLHSRRKAGWHAGLAERYDYSYSAEELQGVLAEWSALAGPADKVYTFFNNCHRGQAGQNAEAFRRLLGQV